MSEKIFVVDDEPEIVAVLVEFLKDLDYEVTGTSDPAKATDRVRSFLPDLCILDYRMPGISGGALLDAIRELDPTIEVVFLTAETDTQFAVEVMRRGAIDYLLKPIDLDALELAVERALRNRQLVRENLEYKRRLETLIEEKTEAHRLLRQLFGRYVSEDVAAEVMTNPTRYLKLGGESRVATVLFADIRGFTQFSEQIEAIKAVETLNAHLSQIVEVVFGWGGTLDKFQGDGVMAVFGAPVTHDDDPARAVRCALDIRGRIDRLSLAEPDAVRLHMGIGINTGLVIAGSIGSEKRLDYTVIGDTVNVASRLESMAGPGQILISANTYESVQQSTKVRKLGAMRFKGKNEPIVAYDVIDWVGAQEGAAS